MIDISNIVLRVVKESVQAVYPDCYFTTTNPDSVSKSRVVSMTEIDNYTYQRSLDDSLYEHHANIALQFDVYSNNTEGKKKEAKEIMDLVDNAMQSMKFVRTYCNPTPNIDRSYYRITARYKAVVAEGVEENGDTIYQIYRR